MKKVLLLCLLFLCECGSTTDPTYKIYGVWLNQDGYQLYNFTRREWREIHDPNPDPNFPFDGNMKTYYLGTVQTVTHDYIQVSNSLPFTCGTYTGTNPKFYFRFGDVGLPADLFYYVLWLRCEGDSSETKYFKQPDADFSSSQ